MKQCKLLVYGVYLALSGMIIGCGQTPSSESPPYSTQLSNEASIERGRYLVALMDCNSCHTPKKMSKLGPVPDPDKLLSGHPADQPFQGIPKEEGSDAKWLRFNHDLTTAIGPWGVSFSANLTPDPTGLGEWTFEQFKIAITEGKHEGKKDGRMVLPPMPWQSYAELKDKDIHAIFDYLKSIKPIKNQVPPPIPPSKLASNI